jgi:hypothetical protein
LQPGRAKPLSDRIPLISRPLIRRLFEEYRSFFDTYGTAYAARSVKPHLIAVRHSLGASVTEAENAACRCSVRRSGNAVVTGSPVPKKAVPWLGLVPVAELAAQSCSQGWRRGQWRGLSGEWHWGPCFPSWRRLLDGHGFREVARLVDVATLL